VLALLLIKHASGPQQHAAQRDLLEQIGMAAAFSTDVAEDAAEIGFELL
jgi:hypothetical protein